MSHQTTRTPAGKRGARAASRLATASLFVLAVFAGTTAADSDEADARELLKAMSDYLAAEKDVAFAYDSDLEVVTSDLQKVTFASSGTVTLSRPDKIRVTRSGGFSDVELIFDGKLLTVVGKNRNLYGQAPVEGSIDDLIDMLRIGYDVQAPGADLLFSNVYDGLIEGVTDVKDLGSGMVGGVECNHLAFRADDLDWQIWIAAGDAPYPCRYVITSKLVAQAPEYRVQLRGWKAGEAVAADDFVFKNTTDAKQAQLSDLQGLDELPNLATDGGAQ